MPGLKGQCKDLFGKDNFYDVLGASKEASEAELKKCYYRLSLRVHPDRVDDKEKESATNKFQVLGRVYAILADEEKRRIYDETGEDPDDDDGDISDVNKDWHAHWRRMFPAISEEMIRNFHATYAGSAQEKDDLKVFYDRFDGNMEKVFEWIIHQSEDDVERLQAMVEEMIEAGELTKTSTFTKTKLTKRKKTQRRKRAAEEAAEAEDMLTQIKKKHRMSEDASLEALLRKRAEDRESLNGSFLEALEAKYCGGRGRGDDDDDDDDDDEVEENEPPPPKRRNNNAKGKSKGSKSRTPAKNQRGNRKARNKR